MRTETRFGVGDSAEYEPAGERVTVFTVDVTFSAPASDPQLENYRVRRADGNIVLSRSDLIRSRGG